MGSERKSSKKKHKRASPSSSSEQDDGKRKRARTLQDKDEIKSDKKKKHKSHKSSSKHHSDRDTKSEEKHKRKHHKHDIHAKVKFQELSKEDYFSKNNEFATWLKEEKDVFFSDLSSETARDLFSEFAKDWNNRKLETRYYEGITSGPRTSHKWKIK